MGPGASFQLRPEQPNLPRAVRGVHASSPGVDLGPTLHLLQPCLPLLLTGFSGWTLEGWWTWFIPSPFLGLSLNPITSTQLCLQCSDPVGPRSDSEGTACARSPLFPASSPSWSRPADIELGENYRNRLNILNCSCLLPTLCFPVFC